MSAFVREFGEMKRAPKLRGVVAPAVPNGLWLEARLSHEGMGQDLSFTKLFYPYREWRGRYLSHLQGIMLERGPAVC